MLAFFVNADLPNPEALGIVLRPPDLEPLDLPPSISPLQFSLQHEVGNRVPLQTLPPTTIPTDVTYGSANHHGSDQDGFGNNQLSNPYGSGNQHESNPYGSEEQQRDNAYGSGTNFVVLFSFYLFILIDYVKRNKIRSHMNSKNHTNFYAFYR